MQTEQLKRKAHSAIDQAANKAEELEKATRSNAAQARQSVAEHGDTIAEGAGEAWRTVGGFVKDRPYAAAGLAAAAVLLGARLLKN